METDARVVMTRDRKFWEKVVEAVDGGTTRAEAAARFNVTPAALQYWILKFRRERAGKVPEVLPVRVEGERRDPITIELDGVTVRVPTTVPPEYVAGLVRALHC